MYLIGKVAEKTGLSVRTIRYYDEEGIVTPSYVDQFTSYRYYSDEDVYDLNHVTYLKQCGLSLSDVSVYLQNKQNPEKQYEVLIRGQKKILEGIGQMKKGLALLDKLKGNIEQAIDEKQEKKQNPNPYVKVYKLSTKEKTAV